MACSPTPLSSATIVDNENEATTAETQQTNKEAVSQKEPLPTDVPAMQIYPNPTRTWTEFYFNIPGSNKREIGCIYGIRSIY